MLLYDNVKAELLHNPQRPCPRLYAYRLWSLEWGKTPCGYRPEEDEARGALKITEGQILPEMMCTYWVPQEFVFMQGQSLSKSFYY